MSAKEIVAVRGEGVPRSGHNAACAFVGAWTNRLMLAILALACSVVPLPAIASNILVAKTGGVSAESRVIERGRYLVMVGGCNDCHTERFMRSGTQVQEGDRLTGSSLGWRGAGGTVYATNLRLFFTNLTEPQWIAMAREMQRRPPMPYYSLNAMSTSDLKAIYRYVRFLGPAGGPAPQFVPPEKDPPQPYVLFPSQ